MGDATLNIPLLDRLRDAGGVVAIESLGEDREAVLVDLRALEAFGFRLAWAPYGGVAYMGPAPRLCPDQIEHALGADHIGRRIAVWERVASTNDLAMRAASTAANEGLVILAEHQTAGRGRRGRSWSAAPGRSILMSAVLCPPTALEDVAWLTALGAVAAAEAVEASGVDSGGIHIRWPNDVYVGARKIAGVLVERGPGVVLGIGLNVNQATDEFDEALRQQATSLRIETGREMDRSALARVLIQSLDARYAQAIADGRGALNAAWRKRLAQVGRDVRLRTTAGVIEGRLVDADLVLGLSVVRREGTVQTVASAQVLGFDETL